MVQRDVDSVDTACDPAPDRENDPALVWWLIQLARTDRETYRRVRALAWKMAISNPGNSALPNERS